MSKRKKQSANLNKQSKVKREIIQLEDCSKNDECGVSVVDDVKVIVFYNGPNYKVKISISKRSITKKILKVQNSKFDLYIRFEDTDYSKSGGHLYIELKGRYKLEPGPTPFYFFAFAAMIPLGLIGFVAQSKDLIKYHREEKEGRRL